LPLVREKKLRALAVTGATRVASLPDVPTVAEAGVPGYDASSWYAVLAPAGTPPEYIQRMHAAVVKSFDSPELKQRFDAEGLEPGGLAPAEFEKMLKSELVKWADVVKASGLKI
jgi:tripartite-type tricarboxylate transporter receptor subunit TctC